MMISSRSKPPGLLRRLFQFRIGTRGQQWSVLKLLQGGVLAVVMMTIVWGVVQTTREQIPPSHVYSVTCETLSSAYAAAQTPESFVVEALLVPMEFEAESLAQCAGLPSYTSVNLHCRKAYCYDPKTGDSLDATSKCRKNSPCSEMGFYEGQTIKICMNCPNLELCEVWFGETEC